MSEPNTVRQPGPVGDGNRRSDEGGLRPPPGLSTRGKIWWWFDFLILVNLARLRFIAILIVLGLLIVHWDTLVAYYEKWTRPLFGQEQVADPDTEYYCPMHPRFVTTNPKEKCPICGMNLSKQTKGKAKQEALPAGVVTRLQLSPYKVVAAGIRTWDVKYERLAKEIETVGTVEFDERKLRRIPTNVKGRIDELYANVTGEAVGVGDKLASIYSPEIVSTVQNLLDARRDADKELIRSKLRLLGIADEQIKEWERVGKPITHVTIRSPISGHVLKKYQVEGEWVDETARLFDVADLSTVWIEAQVYEDDVAFLKEGLAVSATTRAFPNRPLPGKLAFIQPHANASARTVSVRFDLDNPGHALRPGMYATVKIEVPATRLGQQFLSQEGLVLAVPETAGVHTGNQKIVYRQEGPTVYDAVPVELGPPINGPDGASFYPVVRGLEAGDKIVTVGSYLLDAETRVSAAAGSIYYGGSGAGAKEGQPSVTTVRPSTPEDEEAKVKAGLAKLSTPDRRLAEAQKLCPILGTKLGAMGAPVKVMLKGQPVFLCCKNCEKEAREHPDETLDKVEKSKAGAKPETPRP